MFRAALIIFGPALALVLIHLSASQFFDVSGTDALVTGRLWQMFFVQLCATAMVLAFVLANGGMRAVGFNRMAWSGLPWLLPAIVVLALMVANVQRATDQPMLASLEREVLFLIVAIAGLIALSEEIVFRGWVLRRGLLVLSPVVALVASAVSFGLFHFVNLALGQGLLQTGQQVVFAVLVGISLAPLALKLNSLWPLILWHWAWNGVVVLSQLNGVIHPYVQIGMAFQAVISLWLWIDIGRNHQFDQSVKRGAR